MCYYYPGLNISSFIAKQLQVRKRAKIAKTVSSECVGAGSSAPYSVKSSINAPPPVQLGVNIRAPPPMNFNPQTFIGRHSPAVEQNRDIGAMKVFNQGGKKFVTLSSLTEAAEKGKMGLGKKK